METKLNITPGIWRIVERDNPTERKIPFGVEAPALHAMAVEPIVDVYAFPPNEDKYLERYKDNCTAICNAVNNTYGKGIDPESIPSILKQNEELKAQLSSFYMDICRAYNAGKQNQSDVIKFEGAPFKSSHDYFKSEFPNFEINVP